jgi:hypothetical protein
MSYYTNTQGLYYNSQFDVDKVKQEIFTIRNLQNTLTQKLTILDQIYDSDQQQKNSITLLNTGGPTSTDPHGYLLFYFFLILYLLFIISHYVSSFFLKIKKKFFLEVLV